MDDEKKRDLLSELGRVLIAGDGTPIFIVLDGEALTVDQNHRSIVKPNLRVITGGLSMREWNCRCHVCGRVWVLKADFISCAQWADGTLMLTCSGDPTIPQPAHTPAEIHESWLRHGRPTA